MVWYVALCAVTLLFCACVHWRQQKLGRNIAALVSGFASVAEYVKVSEARNKELIEYVALLEERHEHASILFRYILGPQEEQVITTVDPSGMSN